MISEAAWFGKPVYLLRLTGGSEKFDRLHKSFLDHGAARWFSGNIETWKIEPLREIDRVADRIVDLLLKRRPATGIDRNVTI